MEQDVYSILRDLNIDYNIMSHKAVYTSEEAMFITKELGGTGVKNLFLKNKKKFFLVLIPEDKKANIKEIESMIGEKNLSFANANYLKEILGLTPGSVTPFGVINDKDNKVTVLIDDTLVGKEVLFHPNVNTKTIKINYNDLIKFLDSQNHKYKVLKENSNE